MNVLVCIDMVDGQSGRPERLELGGDFGGELATGAPMHEYVDGGMNDIVPEMAGVVDKVAEIPGRKHGSAVDQHEMQTDAQVRQAARDRDGVGAMELTDHQACSGENAVAMSNRHRFVHLPRQAE